MEYLCYVAMFMVYSVGLASGDCESQCSASTCWTDTFSHMECVAHCTQNGYSCPPAIPAPVTQTSVVQYVEAFNKNWANQMKTENMNGIKDIYTEDCTYIIPSVGFGTGKTEMLKAYTEWFGGNEDFDHVEFTVAGAGEGSGLVFGYGKMITHFSDSRKPESDDYVKFFKRVNGKLMGYIDVIED